MQLPQSSLLRGFDQPAAGVQQVVPQISRCNMPNMMQQSMGCLQGQSIVTPSWKNPKISPETVLSNHDPGT